MLFCSQAMQNAIVLGWRERRKLLTWCFPVPLPHGGIVQKVQTRLETKVLDCALR